MNIISGQNENLREVLPEQQQPNTKNTIFPRVKQTPFRCKTDPPRFLPNQFPEGFEPPVFSLHNILHNIKRKTLNPHQGKIAAAHAKTLFAGRVKTEPGSRRTCRCGNNKGRSSLYTILSFWIIVMSGLTLPAQPTAAVCIYPVFCAGKQKKKNGVNSVLSGVDQKNYFFFKGRYVKEPVRQIPDRVYDRHRSVRYEP